MVTSTKNDEEWVPTEVLAATALASLGAVLELVECLATNGALTDVQLSGIHERFAEPLDMVANRDDPSMCLLRDAIDNSFATSRKNTFR